MKFMRSTLMKNGLILKIVVYIDSDLLINKDILELYRQDIGDNLIGAVRHVVDDWLKNYLDTKLHIPYEDYFNAGVLLINTKKLAADNIMEKCIELLYGAGDVGHTFYNQIKDSECCKLVLWVDRNYQKIGSPVKNPETIKETEFDKVVISVIDKHIADIIRNYLKKMGVKEDNIIWVDSRIL
jgi:lipopolysaccharide biosynthesis glycosyltransferase